MAKFLRKKNTYANAGISTKFLAVRPAAMIFFVSCSEVFISALYPLDAPMETEPFKDSGHGRRTDIFQMLADILSLYFESHVFAPADRFQYLRSAKRFSSQ